jgi:hypothetical protein
LGEVFLIKVDRLHVQLSFNIFILRRPAGISPSAFIDIEKLKTCDFFGFKGVYKEPSAVPFFSK